MFYSAHCDNNCKGCEKNKAGWCIWKDRATPDYHTEAFTASRAPENSNPLFSMFNPECRQCPNNPLNGGSGICNCTLGLPKVTC